MLTSNIVCLTGAAGDFGYAIAARFAEQGARLALLDRDEKRLGTLVQDLRKQGYQVESAVADLRSAAGVRAGMSAVLASYDQQLDVLVSNVGVLFSGPFAQLSDDMLADSLTINFWTHVWACREALPRMRGRVGANIVLMGSDQGSQPDAGLVAYASAKAALHAFAKVLAREAAEDVRVNVVAPGMARSRTDENFFCAAGPRGVSHDTPEAERLEIQRRGIPLARLAEPIEVAEAVLFLADNLYCTGSILDISGGNLRGV